VPTKDEHRAKAEHNESLSLHLRDPFSDWAITGMFYSATHFVESYLATVGIHFTNHTLRESYVYRDAKLKPISRNLRTLRTHSEDARYMDEVPPTKFKQSNVDALRPNLEAIKKVVLPLI
jgi:hypothetical protein